MGTTDRGDRRVTPSAAALVVDLLPSGIVARGRRAAGVAARTRSRAVPAAPPASARRKTPAGRCASPGIRPAPCPDPSCRPPRAAPSGPARRAAVGSVGHRRSSPSLGPRDPEPGRRRRPIAAQPALCAPRGSKPPRRPGRHDLGEPGPAPGRPSTGPATGATAPSTGAMRSPPAPDRAARMRPVGVLGATTSAARHGPLARAKASAPDARPRATARSPPAAGRCPQRAPGSGPASFRRPGSG
jgi:translation initiation factor IF-2